MPGQVIEGAAPLLREIGIRPRVARALRAATLAALCTILMLGPLALGIVQAWSVAMFEAGCAITLLFWMASQIAEKDLRLRWSPLFTPMLLFVALVLGQIAFHRTAYLYDSLSELWLCLGYGILAFVAVQIFRADDRFILLFGKILAVFGSLYAVFAVLQGFTSANKIYWLIKPRAGSVYGSYVNHNHYAGLMELLLPFVLVLAFGGRVRGAKRLLLGFAAILMAASVFLSQSRGGMLSLIVEMAFLAIIWMRQFSPKKSAVVFVSFCLVTALFLAWVAPQKVGSRIADTHDPARWLIHRDSVRMFAAHPFLGSGFGTFPAAFPHYRIFYDGFFINHAHDDYLELSLETGLVGFALGLWFIVALYRAGLRNLGRNSIGKTRPSSTALMGVAALAGCTGLLAHSGADFNLHVPANAALFYVLCALATIPQVGGGKGGFRIHQDRNF